MQQQPQTASSVTDTNGASATRPRSGIPRYAIPYRRPSEQPSMANDNGHSQSDSQSTNQPPPPVSQLPAGRGRNGVRTESLGDESIRKASATALPASRYARAASVDPLRGDSESEHSSAFSSSGQPRRITSKIGSLKNANYKPAGGNVQIFDAKLDFSHAQSKCNSKANLKHKPGGGDIQIVDNKLTFKDESKPRVNSLANAKHVPKGGDVKIFNERLPWLRYNKPNLAPQEKARINKQVTGSSTSPTEKDPIYTSGHSSSAS